MRSLAKGGFLFSCLLCGGFIAICVGGAYGRTIYVDADANGANDGTSWRDAFSDLQAGLSASTEGDYVFVAEGVYRPAGPGGERRERFRLKWGVKIKGGYAGFGEPDPDGRDVVEYETILSGDLNGDDARVSDPAALPYEPTRAENSYTVVYARLVEGAVLDGFTITGGNSNGPWNGSWENWRGGGMLIWEESSVRIVRCKIVGNYSEEDGGGVYIFACGSYLENCVIKGNYAGGSGGGLSMGVGGPVVTSCVIKGNKAGSEGGGIYNHNYCTAMLRNCTVVENWVRWYGGGMKSTWNCNVGVSNCIFWGNSQGQIVNDESRTTVVYSDVQGGWGGTGNIDVDPLFEADGYHLGRDSACINAGDPNCTWVGGRDIDGHERLVLGRVDIGADEWRMGVIYVDGDATGANDGSSWADAFNYLQEGLAASAGGDEIRVAEGIYRPDEDSGEPEGSGEREATFALKSGVGLYGGYAGYGAPEPNARDVDLYETVLSGDLSGNDLEGLDPCDLLDELSRAENSYHVITASSADEGTILAGFIITGGHANGSREHSFGGGVTNTGGKCELAACTLVENSALGAGGGMYNWYGAEAVVRGCRFVRNAARTGGGMHNRGVDATLRRCVFSSNVACEDGGGMLNRASEAKLRSCRFSGNKASGYGGALVMNNTGSILTNCTLTENSAGAVGGGIYCYWAGVGLSNCIIWGNSDVNGVGKWSEISPEESELSGNYNCVRGWAADLGVVGNIDSDPCFVEAGYWDANGAWVEGDYRLRRGSPCIDAGDVNYAAEPNETDILGNQRVIGERIDIGAYEFAGNVAPVACVVGGNRTVEATGPETGVVLDGSCSSDLDSTAGTNDDIVSFDWYEGDSLIGSGETVEPGLALGEHLIVLAVTDRADAYDAVEVRITVEDTLPPVITLSGAATIVLECGADSYLEQGATAWDICDGNVAVLIGGDTVDAWSCGTYLVTYDAIDASGNDAEQVVRTVVVEDVTPPEFSLAVEPNELWPPNGKMVLVRPEWEVSDNCDEEVEVSLADISMSAAGDINDYVEIGDDGSIYLRARKGGSGRIYILTYEAVDDSGNVAEASVTAAVRHRKGPIKVGGKSPVILGRRVLKRLYD